MLQQVLPKGQTKAADEVIDRTSVLDAAELWPDPLDCPDWPHLTGDQRYAGERGRRGAEARLELIGGYLNRARGRLRAPTKAERENLFASIFRRSGDRWQSLRLNGLSPSGSHFENEATLIVEAAHIRGYLRKLDALEAKAAEDREREARERAQRKLDSYAPALASGTAEMDRMADAVARHEQRLADELAFMRCGEIRAALRAGHFEASQAARQLGVPPPAEPKLD